MKLELITAWIEKMNAEEKNGEALFCGLVNLTPMGLRNIMEKGTSPRLKTLIRICDLLGVSLDEFSRRDNKSKKKTA